MKRAPAKPVPLDFQESVQRLLTWSALGCRLHRIEGRWQLIPTIGASAPFPRPISDAAARAAIAAGMAVTDEPDLFSLRAAA